MNSARILHWLLLTLALTYTAHAVKIGASKVDLPPTTSTSTTTTVTTTTPSTSTMEAPIATATSDFSSFTTEEALAPNLTTLSVPSAEPAKNLTTSIFPPRLKTTKAPPTTTTEISTTEGALLEETTVSHDSGADANTGTQSHWYTSTGQQYCYCDLLLGACDLNCCCDHDCSSAALQVFNCNADPKYPELKSRLEDFQYQHGLPSCKINDGWLCVFRSNTQQKATHHSYTNLDTTNYYKWTTPMWDTDLSAPKTDYYKFADPIQLLNMETMELKLFELPYAYAPPYCHISEPLRFLRATHVNCLLNSAEELQLNARNLLNLAQTSKLLLKPLQHFTEPEQWEHILGVLSMRKCKGHNCTTLGLMDNADMETQLDDFYPNGISITLLHNYTQLIAAFIEMNETAPTDGAYWQRYQVTYMYRNLTASSGQEKRLDLADDSMLTLSSGPLGYLQGEPIIVSQFVALNHSEPISTNNRILDYFLSNATRMRGQHTLRLFTQRNALCHKNNATKNYINFGISTMKQCKVRLAKWSADQPLAQHNFTQLCQQLQSLIAIHLFDTSPDFLSDPTLTPPELYLSQLGKPQNYSDKWISLQVRNHAFVVPIRGEYNAQKQSFSCRNMLLNIAYEFQVAQLMEQGIPHQALVKLASLTLGQRNDLEFSLHEELEVPLMVTVMFYDNMINGMNGAGGGLLARGSIIIIYSALMISFTIYCNYYRFSLFTSD